MSSSKVASLRLAAEDRLADNAVELAVLRPASVLAWFSSKPIISAMRSVNSVKPPETRQVSAPCSAHGLHQSARAGRQRDALGDHLVAPSRPAGP